LLPKDYHLNIQLYGTVKTIQTQHKPTNKLLAAIQMLTLGSTKFYNAHKAELQHFVDCLIKDKKPPPTGEEGLKDLEVIEKAYKNQIRLE
jgi:predicted dehydrogenase